MSVFLFQGAMNIELNRNKLLQLCNSSSFNAWILLKTCITWYLPSSYWNLWVLNSVIWKIFEFKPLIYLDVVYTIHHVLRDFIHQQLMHTFCKLITYLTLTCFGISHLSMPYSGSTCMHQEWPNLWLYPLAQGLAEKPDDF